MMEKKMKFETAMAELEKVIAKLESDDTPLDEAMKLYEKGIGLIRLCNERLDSAEQKIKLLQQSNGQMTETDFGDNNND